MKMSRTKELVEVVDGKLAVHYDENGKVYFIEVL
jgi:uncharacterized protein YuzE